MKTSSTTNKKSKLEEVFALWEKIKGSTVYYTGKTAGDKPINLVAFINNVKKNPNQPDIQIYEQAEKGQEKTQVASLWENKSKAGKPYLWGQDNEGKKLVGFFNDETNGGKYPSIRVYYSELKQYNKSIAQEWSHSGKRVITNCEVALLSWLCYNQNTPLVTGC